MTATLLYGPSFNALREKAFDRADRDAADRPEGVLLFDQNDAQHDTHREVWRTDRNPLRLTVSSLSSFVDRAHDRLISTAPQLGTLERQRVTEQAVRELPNIDDSRRYADSFSELFRTFEAHRYFDLEAVTEALASTNLDATQMETIATAFEQYVEYRSLIVHPAAQTRSRQFHDIATTSDSLAETFPHIDHVIVSGYTDPSPLEIEVLERLASEFPTTILVPTSRGEDTDLKSETGSKFDGVDRILADTRAVFDDLTDDTQYIEPEAEQPIRQAVARMYTAAARTEETIPLEETVEWHEAPTPDREVRHIAREIRSDLTAAPAMDPDDILVLAPGLLSYRDQIDDIFDEYGIKYVSSLSILLEQTYAGRAILDTVALCSDPDSETLIRLATNPLVTLDGIDVPELVALENRTPTTDLATLTDHAPEEWCQALQALRDRIAVVRETDGSAVVAAIAAVIDDLSLSSRIDTLPEGVDSGYEARALQRVRRILVSVEDVCELKDTDPLTEIDAALEGVRVPAPTQNLTNRIRIVGLQDVLMADFSHLYVLGATEEHLPSQPTRPRYFQRVADEFGILPEDQYRKIARYRFGAVLANADSVHITTPAESMNGESLLPSTLVEELTRTAAITRTAGIDDEPRGSPEDVQRALAGASPDALHEPLQAAAADDVFSPPQVQATLTGAVCAANRASHRPTDHDGQLAAETVESLHRDLHIQPYTPSRLRTFAQCGFKFYLKDGMDLAEPADISPDVGRFAVDEVVHETLEQFYTELLAETDGPIDLDAFDLAALERQLYEAGVDAVKSLDESFDSPFDRHQLASLFAGLVPPAENRFLNDSDRARNGRGLFAEFLRRERNQDGPNPFLFEEWFGGDDRPVTLPDGTIVPVHGKIDRIDISDDEPVTAHVLEYKTYTQSAAEAIQGLDFQLPGDVFGATQLIADRLGEQPQVVDSAYRILKPPASVTHKRSLAAEVDSTLDISYEEFLQQVVPKRFDTITTAIEAGAFQPALVGPSDAMCHYCEFSDVCDVRHHRRYETIEAIEDQGHPAYVPVGAHPEGTVDFSEVIRDE